MAQRSAPEIPERRSSAQKARFRARARSFFRGLRCARGAPGLEIYESVKVIAKDFGKAENSLVGDYQKDGDRVQAVQSIGMVNQTGRLVKCKDVSVFMDGLQCANVAKGMQPGNGLFAEATASSAAPEFCSDVDVRPVAPAFQNEREE